MCVGGGAKKAGLTWGAGGGPVRLADDTGGIPGGGPPEIRQGQKKKAVYKLSHSPVNYVACAYMPTPTLCSQEKKVTKVRNTV